MSPADYINSIEACFLALRGRGVQWAPADAALAGQWHDQGVPIGLVVRVVGARVRAWRFRHGDEARMPLHLGWYAPAVAQAVRVLGPTVPRAVAEPAGAPPMLACAEPGLCVAELLDPLEEFLRGTDHLGLKHAYRLAWDVLDRALRRPHDRDDPGDPDDDLADLPPFEAAVAKAETVLRNALVAALQDAERATMEIEIARELAPLRGRLSKKALAVQRAQRCNAWLSRHLDVRWPTVDGWVDFGAIDP
ncbi:MAG: hypothetical protein FJ100_04600 [Deltaproteobacteria bacterium]|nr:hypothetical protein [Deltaproteobacteria bacterium]